MQASISIAPVIGAAGAASAGQKAIHGTGDAFPLCRESGTALSTAVTTSGLKHGGENGVSGFRESARMGIVQAAGGEHDVKMGLLPAVYGLRTVVSDVTTAPAAT
jgi:hypothetical protein